MATKAELEAELKTLRAELAAAKEKIAHTTLDAADDVADATEDVAETGEGYVKGLKKDGETLVADLIDDLEKFSAQQPLLVVAGAFCLGLLLGRK